MPFARSPPEMAHFQWRKWRPLHCNKLIKRPLLKEKENKTKSPFREHRVAFPHDSRGHLEGAKDKEGEREKVTELWTIKAADGKKSHYLRLMILFYFFMTSCVGFCFTAHRVIRCFSVQDLPLFVFICVSVVGSDFPGDCEKNKEDCN